MKKPFFFLIIYSSLFLSGCGQSLDEKQQEVKEREYLLVRTIEPGTISYIYESIGIAIDKTKIALQILQENEIDLSQCFGEDLYLEIVNDYKNKIKFLENEKPYFITNLFFGDSQVSDFPVSYKNYRSKIQSMSQEIFAATKKCLDEKQNEEIAISKQLIGTTPRAAEEAAQAQAAEEAAQAQAPEETNLLDPEATDLRRCYLEVSGEIYIDDPCKGYFYDSGFQISSSEYFADIQIDEKEGSQGFWNEEPHATHAHSDLGPMTKSGPCWKSDKATVCFWE